MAEEEKKYFDEQKLKEAIAWLGKHAPTLKCEVCSHGEWEIGGHFVSPPIFEGGLVIGGRAYPFYMLFCKTCGNTKFFNAVISGALPGMNGGENG